MGSTPHNNPIQPNNQSAYSPEFERTLTVSIQLGKDFDLPVAVLVTVNNIAITFEAGKGPLHGWRPIVKGIDKG